MIAILLKRKRNGRYNVLYTWSKAFRARCACKCFVIRYHTITLGLIIASHLILFLGCLCSFYIYCKREIDNCAAIDAILEPTLIKVVRIVSIETVQCWSSGSCLPGLIVQSLIVPRGEHDAGRLSLADILLLSYQHTVCIAQTIILRNLYLVIIQNVVFCKPGIFFVFSYFA